MRVWVPSIRPAGEVGMGGWLLPVKRCGGCHSAAAHGVGVLLFGQLAAAALCAGHLKVCARGGAGREGDQFE